MVLLALSLSFLSLLWPGLETALDPTGLLDHHSVFTKHVLLCFLLLAPRKPARRLSVCHVPRIMSCSTDRTRDVAPQMQLVLVVWRWSAFARGNVDLLLSSTTSACHDVAEQIMLVLQYMGN